MVVDMLLYFADDLADALVLNEYGWKDVEATAAIDRHSKTDEQLDYGTGMMR